MTNFMWYDDSMMVTTAANDTQNKTIGKLCQATNSSCLITSPGREGARARAIPTEPK